VPLLISPPSNPVLVPPMRRRGSVRRTSTVLMSWPNGVGSGLRLQGRCRDLLTSTNGSPSVIRQAEMDALTGSEREIVSISATPATPDLNRLLGCRAGGNLRASIAQELPDQVDAGTPLHLLLDDLAGSTLIAGFAFVRWADRLPDVRGRISQAPRRYMRDICSGFRDGASSLLSDGTIAGHSQNVAKVPPLVDPDDLIGWHELDDHPPMAMRRARRIDVWDADGTLGPCSATAVGSPTVPKLRSTSTRSRHPRTLTPAHCCRSQPNRASCPIWSAPSPQPMPIGSLAPSFGNCAKKC
jgi:hypothetical protein